jgi:hypothetical protein
VTGGTGQYRGASGLGTVDVVRKPLAPVAGLVTLVFHSGVIPVV